MKCISITSILTLLLLLVVSTIPSTTATSATKALKHPSTSTCEGEDEILKAAVIATIVRKVQAALAPFHQGTAVDNGALISQAFMEKLIKFDNEVGNGNGEMEPREIILFFNCYYQDKCASELLKMFSVLPDAPVAVGPPGGEGGLDPAALIATMMGSGGP